MITLYDVVDIRTGRYHSVVMVKEKDAKYFVPVNEYESGEE